MKPVTWNDTYKTGMRKLSGEWRGFTLSPLWLVISHENHPEGSGKYWFIEIAFVFMRWAIWVYEEY